jgi:hypothetical protein
MNKEQIIKLLSSSGETNNNQIPPSGATLNSCLDRPERADVALVGVMAALYVAFG